MIYWTVTGTSVENMEVKQCTALLTPPLVEPSFEASWQARVVGRHNGRMARNKKNKKLIHNIELENGSLLIMRELTQQYWEHEIPKTKKIVEKKGCFASRKKINNFLRNNKHLLKINFKKTLDWKKKQNAFKFPTIKYNA